MRAGTNQACKDVVLGVDNYPTGGDVSTALAPTTPLTAADRCDRCSAQAYVRVVMPSGSELHFCAHHGRQHSDALAALNAQIHDESDRLHDTPSTAPAEER